jgi:hypothetical protein
MEPVSLTKREMRKKNRLESALVRPFDEIAQLIAYSRYAGGQVRYLNGFDLESE